MAEPPSAAPTIDAVARRAGVSKATVSKALAPTAGRYRVSEATRAKVLAAARELGFGRADGAGRRQGRIALVFGDETPLLEGVNLRQHVALIAAILDRRLEVVYQSMDRGSRDARARALARCDGALLVSYMPYVQSGWRRWLDEIAGFPPVVAINPGLELPLASVEPDDAGGCRSLVADLAGRGHRRLAIVGALHQPMQHGSQHRRHAAIVAACAAAGMACLDWCDRAPPALAAELAAQPRAVAPSALIALSGWSLPALWAALVRAGLDIPQRLALATCDDPPHNRLLDPPITGLHWSMDLLVAAALDHLDAAIDGRPPTAARLIPVAPQHRPSTTGWRPV